MPSVLLVVGLLIGAAASFAYLRIRRLAASGGPLPTWQVIVVPVVGQALPEAALSAAASLARAVGARVVVLGAVRVPRTMNLDAEAAPGLEAALARAEAAELIVRRAGAPVHAELVRVRELSEVIDRACAEVGARLVVLDAGEGQQAGQELLRLGAEHRGLRGFDVLLAGGPAAPRHTLAEAPRVQITR